MDNSKMQAQLETLGAGFKNMLNEKFLATKGKSEVEGTGVFGGTNSNNCPTNYAYYSVEANKAEVTLKQIEKGVEKKLQIWERAYMKGE